MDKVHFRNLYRTRRDRLKLKSDEFMRSCERLSLHVKQFLSDIPRGSLVFGYRAYKSEAPLPWVEGYRWAFPRMKESGLMDFHEAQGENTGFELNPLGIYEPSVSECPQCHVTDAKVVFVPGVAFDKEGFRLGLGKGFYDRFLAPVKGVLKVGIGFQVQLHDGLLPRDPWDLPVDWLITDKSIIGFSRRK